MLEPKPRRITNAQVDEAILVALRTSRRPSAGARGISHDALLNEAVAKLVGDETLNGDLLDLVVGEGLARLREAGLVKVSVAVELALTEAGEKRAGCR